MMSRFHETWRTLWTAALLVGLACAAALAVNAVRPNGLPLIRLGATDGSAGDPSRLNLARARELYDAGVLFIDSRTPEEFAEGHIRGAKHIYYDHAEQEWEAVMNGVDWDAPVVVYCSGEGCNSSLILAEFLRDRGYGRVYLFDGGWPAWSAAGYPVEGRPQEIKLYGVAP
jgi:rhodanese-related sulfurtransferase